MINESIFDSLNIDCVFYKMIYVEIRCPIDNDVKNLNSVF